MLVELNAAKSGVFIGDSYNDMPQSAQRRLEIELEQAEVQARLQGGQAEIKSLTADLEAEQERQIKLAKASVRATVHGRVWEMLTAPGEHVNAGQDLLKVLDCGSAIVTASVSETVFQRLKIGQTATFTRRSDGVSFKGAIVDLNGLAAVDSNSAILQGLLSREPFHVSLKFPELAAHADCQVGLTGLVTFDMPERTLGSFLP
jgi:multidrug efflux pump subunit AcrA (membrane-fusion protein)